VSLVLQIGLGQDAHLRLVLDNQNRRHHASPAKN
jgi:hypothetical protein